MMLIVSNIGSDPFVAGDSQKTEQCPQLIHCYTVAGKNTEEINKQIYNKPHNKTSTRHCCQIHITLTTIFHLVYGALAISMTQPQSN